MNDLIQNNPSLFIALVCGAAALFLIGFVVAKVMAGKKKAALRQQGGLAEIVFDATVRSAAKLVTDVQFAGYKIYAVNGREPQIAGTSIFVPKGPNILELEYIDTEYASRHRSLTTLHGRKTVALDAKEGATYRMCFHEDSGEFELKS